MVVVVPIVSMSSEKILFWNVRGLNGGAFGCYGEAISSLSPGDKNSGILIGWRVTSWSVSSVSVRTYSVSVLIKEATSRLCMG
jgi:hypothetical protein